MAAQARNRSPNTRRSRAIGKAPAGRLRDRKPCSAGPARRRPPPKKERAAHWIATAIPMIADARKPYGLGVVVGLAFKSEGIARCLIGAWSDFTRQPGGRHTASLIESLPAGCASRLAASLAHPDRVRILCAILSGASTHKDLSGRVGLKAGPLYHHLRAIERGGLVRLSARNAYQVTEAGRIAVVLVTLAAAYSEGACWKAAEWRSVRAPRYISRAPKARRGDSIPAEEATSAAVGREARSNMRLRRETHQGRRRRKDNLEGPIMNVMLH